MPMQNICDGILGFIFGALLNTQITIALAMYFLGQYPKSLQQIRVMYNDKKRQWFSPKLCTLRSKTGMYKMMQEEFQQKVKDRDRTAKLTWDDYKNMEFCQSVIPVIPFTLF